MHLHTFHIHALTALHGPLISVGVPRPPPPQLTPHYIRYRIK